MLRLSGSPRIGDEQQLRAEGLPIDAEFQRVLAGQRQRAFLGVAGIHLGLGNLRRALVLQVPAGAVEAFLRGDRLLLFLWRFVVACVLLVVGIVRVAHFLAVLFLLLFLALQERDALAV